MAEVRWVSLAALLVFATAAVAQNPFTEEASSRGLLYDVGYTEAYGFGAAFADLDGDGDPDVILLGRIDGTVGLFENDGTGQFSDRYAGSGVPLVPEASGVSAGDYDADGDLDLYFSNYLGSNLLMRNEGNWNFTDVTAAAGVGDAGAGTGTTWGDFDGDGWIDLFLGNRTGTMGSPIPNRLYRNLGNGTFTDVLGAAGMTGDDMTFQGVFFDYDQDGDADLYLAADRCTPGNRFWENMGGTFVDSTTGTGTGACMNAMCTTVGDFDDNGLQDLYVTNTPEGNMLFLNQGNGSFTDATSAAGVGANTVGWGSVFVDFDNDGTQELYVTNQIGANHFFVEGPSWPCADEASSMGLADPGQSFAVASADIDADGDVDLLLANMAYPPPPLQSPVPVPVRLFVNHEGETRNRIRFRVAGSGPNRFALGAQVEITAGALTRMSEVIAGSNYKAQNELVLHFGLDNLLQADTVQVVWPGGGPTRSLQNLDANRTWTLYPPEALGDGDQDGDVELDDFVVFAGCHAAASFEPGCEMMDLDGNGDVEGPDFTQFLARYDGPSHDCDANGTLDLQDIIDGALSDAGNGVPDECETLGAPAGAGVQLTVERLAGGGLRLTWGSSCIPGDGDYAIYEGDMAAGFGSHTSKLCSTGGVQQSDVAQPAGDAYYLVVATNGAREGSYGTGPLGAERPQAAAACLLQQTGACAGP